MHILNNQQGRDATSAAALLDQRIKPSSYYDRVVDLMEELLKFTLPTRHIAPYLADRYSERKESAEKLHQRLSLAAAI